MLGWLWNISVDEGHIFSKAFFYFICLDLMLYSGKRDLGVYEAWGVTLPLELMRLGVTLPLGQCGRCQGWASRSKVSG